MNPTLRSMMLVIGTMAIGGTTYLLATRQPPDITMAELRDAGAVTERDARWVAVCPEKITAATARYLKRNGYGDFRAGTIHRIARVVWEYNEDRPLPPLMSACDSSETTVLDGGWCRRKVVLNPSLVATLPMDESEDGGDEDDATDDSFQFRLDDCYRLECNNADGGLNELRLLPDAGFRHMRADGGEVPWCNSGTRRGRVTPPCTIPNCWVGDGGAWVDDAVVDCQGTGPLGEFGTGAPRWRGCNVAPAQYTVGTQCVPVECTVVAGDDAPSVLR